MHNDSNRGRVAPHSPAIHAVCNCARKTELQRAHAIARARTAAEEEAAAAAWERHARDYAWALFAPFGDQR